MKVSGSAILHAPRARVWTALQDPAVLVRTIPGCQRLEQVGADSYRATVEAGVASIKGIYSGDVRLTDQAEPDSFVLHAAGAGAPGTVTADVRVNLADADGGVTRLDYDADAVVGGVIGGVGQRMLASVAKKTAGEFFAAVDNVLSGAEVSAVAGEDRRGAPGIYTAPPRHAQQPSAALVLSSGAVGALIALGGVVVGWLISRPRSRRQHVP
jgi:uncharacterized protein